MEIILIMELIGFIKEHNKIEGAKSYTDLVSNYSNEHGIIVERVIDYLNKGKLLLSWMGYFFDLEDNSIIAPDSYYTDGVYIWPAYLPHYLKKNPDLYLDETFLNILAEKKFEFKISDNNLEKMEEDLSRILQGLP